MHVNAQGILCLDPSPPSIPASKIEPGVKAAASNAGVLNLIQAVKVHEPQGEGEERIPLAYARGSETTVLHLAMNNPGKGRPPFQHLGHLSGVRPLTAVV